MSLVAWWPLNEGSGDTLVDNGPNGYDGTRVSGGNGGIWTNDLDQGICLSYDGSSWSDFPSLGLDPMSAFSMRYRARITALGGTDTPIGMTLEGDPSINLQANTTDGIKLHYYTTSWAESASVDFKTAYLEWIEFTIQANLATNEAIAKVNNDSRIITGLNAEITDSGNTNRIGKKDNGGTTYFTGRVSQIRVWDTFIPGPDPTSDLIMTFS